jgi:hypothetical protein
MKVKAPMKRAGDHNRIKKNLRSEDWQCHTRIIFWYKLI